MNSPLTLAVIGHVNHGKTALVRALTGMETDRLKEEKDRGLSITLGFAWRDYVGGSLDLIDAPGHEDFLRAMVSGTTGARGVLLVISAVEGFGRQTREHLQIAALLGIKLGVVAVTKSDVLFPEGEAVLRAEIAATLAGTFLADQPVVFCSAVTGAGLQELHQALEEMTARAPRLEVLAGAFLPIDRAFTLSGSGTVITGTLLGGDLRAGGEAVLEPSGRKVSLRGIQRRGQGIDVAQSGGRVAVNLRGVSAQDIKTGEVLCAPGAFDATQQVDVWLSVAPTSVRPLKHMDEIRVMWGARQDVATARLLGEKMIAPGGAGLAQLQFAAPVVAYGGQRAVLRRLSPGETLGGMEVLDPLAPPARGKVAPRRALLEAVMTGDVGQIADHLARRDRDLLSLAEVSRLSRRPANDVRQALVGDYVDLDAGRLARRGALDQVCQAYLERVTAAHAHAPTRASHPVNSIRAALSAHRDLIALVERILAAAGEISLEADRVSLPGHDPLASLTSEALQRLAQIEEVFRESPLMPPHGGLLVGWEAEDQALINMLDDADRLLSLRNTALRQTLFLHPCALDIALQVLRASFPPPQAFTTGAAREALATSRKFIVPVLEALDAQGETLRQGDLRQVTR